jgi:hypothetical protein
MVERTKKTSPGGAADLPDALSGRVRSLDYKTLRFSGHYGWIQKQLIELKDQQTKLQPYSKNASRNTANRRGPDCFICCGRRKRHRRGFAKTEVSSIYFPKGKPSRAIQTTTAPLVQAAQLLLEQSYKGVLLQSQINSEKFLNGNYIVRVYGKTKLTN